MIVRISAPGGIAGRVAAPPSKSMAHRAVLCAALGRGFSHVWNLEFSKDITATLGAVGQLSARVLYGPDCTQIQGLGGFLTVTRPVDCCESGSTLRFLIPLFSLTNQPVTFTGRGRLPERPQTVYEQIFRRQGLKFEQTAEGISIDGALRPDEFTVAGDVSSQFISGLLLTLPLLYKESTVHILPPVESRSYIDMTRAVQADFGVKSEWVDDTTLRVPGGQYYHPCEYTVEGDYSQAAFLAVLGAVCGGVTVTGLSPDTLQGDAAILPILARCGAHFTRTGSEVHFEKSELNATHIDLADCPDLGPILMVLGLFCHGVTVIENAGRLRLKESDRIAAMEEELRKCGGWLESEGGTITIHSSFLHTPDRQLSGHNDHRVVMSLTVLSLASGIPVEIEGAEAIKKSWPKFFFAVNELGAEVTKLG